MRKFAFVVFDIDNSVLARFPLDLVTDISGLGWKLKLSKIEGDVVSVLTKVTQEKQAVNITVNFLGRGYEKHTILSQWLQKYSYATYCLALEYDDGLQKRYVEGRVTSLGKTEKDQFQNLACAVTFTPLTPFFTSMENTIKIQVSATGKSYPFKYPYAYGKNIVENNLISNPYLAEIPVTVKIWGALATPVVRLINETGETYNTVSFPNLNLESGQYVLINSAQRKIYYFNGDKIRDYTAETDPSQDTFLMAQSGVSKISVNLAASDSGSLTGSWRQYSL